MLARQSHPYHLVDISPWPILMSISVYSLAMILVSWLSGLTYQTSFATLGLVSLFGVCQIVFLWWRDVIRESQGGYHTTAVQKGILIGFLLFLLSEIMLFFSFIWGYLHSSLAPTIELGGIWPPIGIESINPWNLPLVGTCLLLSSGMTITYSHHALITGNKSGTLISLAITIILGLGFIILQSLEYFYCSYQISDSVYGTVFFMLTGLHGLHVIAGVSFLIVCFIRFLFEQFTTEHHNGFLFAIWYWHLVDVVWLIVYLMVYLWGA